MGISTNFYTIHGIKIDWDDDFNEAYDQAFDDADTPYVLVDGMCGEYMVFGTVLFDSGDMRWGFEDGDQYREIDVPSLTQLEYDYKESFRRKFSRFKHLIDEPFKLMTLAHFS